MKQALTIGCGSSNSNIIVDTLVEQGYVVTNIGNSTHPKATNIQIQWNELQITNLHKLCKINGVLDFVFFNQNGSSLNHNNFDFSSLDTLGAWKLVKDWQQSHWISCQMPFLLLHTLKQNLTSSTKIGWMLSSTMRWDNSNATAYPDYSSQKYFNYLAMRCIGDHHQTFGIMPDFSKDDAHNKLKNIIKQVCTQDINNKLFNFE